MIIVSQSKLQCENLSEWISDALRYNRLMSALNDDAYINEYNESASSAYNRLMSKDYEHALVSLRKLCLSESGKTLTWSTPEQIKSGPYAGWWCIACPMRNGEIREEWVYQIDPLTNKQRDRSVWDGAEIVNPEPSWFNAYVNINEADSATLQTLSGVSEARAQAIIDGRPWADPMDLTQISGISAAMVEGWMDDPGLEV